MKGERKMKEAFREELNRVWKVANEITGSRLRYPDVEWFHIVGDKDEGNNTAAYAQGKGKIAICIEYAYYFRETMFAVLIHEASHCFADHLNEKRGIWETDHGKEWRKMATRLAKALDCHLAVANHAFHTMHLSREQIAYCKSKPRKKNVAVCKPVWEWD
jgi:hypothetical protein